jgi:hypothetical protein
MQRYEAIALSGPNEGIYATLISLPLFSTALENKNFWEELIRLLSLHKSFI